MEVSIGLQVEVVGWAGQHSLLGNALQAKGWLALVVGNVNWSSISADIFLQVKRSCLVEDLLGVVVWNLLGSGGGVYWGWSLLRNAVVCWRAWDEGWN